jgi:Prokaryotic E2 family A/ThiF family/Prokaryotic homologs of the JAB domain
MVDGDQRRHTAGQQTEEPAKLSPAIAHAAETLRAAFPGQQVPILKWNANYVAVPLEVQVNLPSRGPVGGIDIRAQEPVFLLFNRGLYPYVAPSAWSDRLDFPKTKLPHLNPTKPGAPAHFCLHRGSLDAWFAEHDVLDLVQRTRFWLRDAARGRLIPERDAFEPTRPYETFGEIIFDPESLRSKIAAAWALSGGAPGFLLSAYELLDKDAKAAVGITGYGAREIVTLELGTASNLLNLAQRINALADDPAYEKQFHKWLFGIVAWGRQSSITKEYFGELPDRLGGLLEWVQKLEIPLDEPLTAYLQQGFHLLGGVPVTVAIRRPCQLIGGESDLELITFLVLAANEQAPKDGAWNLDAEVLVADHRTPLTPGFARYLSSHVRDFEFGQTLVLGCGALGSKVALHFARSGQTALTLVDPARLSPHNVVRHALGGRRIGMSKSEALKNDVVELYPGEDDSGLGIAANAAGAFDYLFGERRPELEAHAHLIDATASVQVLNMLINAALPSGLSVARIEIGDMGRLGFLSIEGPSRNPRVDDLQVALFDSALDDLDVSRWLVMTREARDHQVGSGLEDIQIGLSCASATMRLADETASFHAAAFASRLRTRLFGPSSRTGGLLYRTTLEDGGAARADERLIAPLTIISARNDQRWEIRFASGLAREMKNALRNSQPKETGGILIGLVHSKRRIIYVTRLLSAPKDSRRSPVCFVRGIRDLPEAVADIESHTGRLLGYVGEWHTHPLGGPDLSPTDISAAVALKKNLDRVPMPTHITVVTPRGIYPHVFEPGSDRMLIGGRRPVAGRRMTTASEATTGEPDIR